MSWPLVKLGDLFKVTSGGTPSRKKSEYYDGGDIHWVKTGDLHNKYVRSASEFITQEGLDGSSARLYPKGTVLVAMYGATIGACSILDIEAATNQACAAFIPTEKVDSVFLYYLLKHSKPAFVKAGSGGAQPNISGTFLKNFEIPLPPLDEQKRIAAILDKADAIRQKRKQAIGLADEFLRSVFLDMFGDPVTNPKGWGVRKLQDLTSKLGSGSTPRGGKEAYLSAGISLIRSLNVHDNTFIYKDLAFISNEQAEKLKNVVVQEQDILLNITGASVCRCTMVPSNVLPARVNQHVCIIRVDRELLLPEFAKRLITSTSFKQMLMRIATSGGATREALTKQQVENLTLIVPPMELQKKFCDIVGKVLDIDTKTNKQVAFPLFDSLSQKAFSGQL
ncbi:restriction endonuclease subunit S [Vibrio bathopelagicus]|uniref:restriction endonuclease subunit S n=1 Tax=Vibrio bathopelagicus TaxID=2777577 RepID=UPI00186508C3|nr:restriction endonuclease subunit S [Vibrio bathopelagicus]